MFILNEVAELARISHNVATFVADPPMFPEGSAVRRSAAARVGISV
jgi:hypothetical protein